MIHQHLQRHGGNLTPDAPAGTPFSPHLDEDALAAFVEGRLGEAESAPLVSHLVSCYSCRHITAQLVRLESQLGEAEEPIAAAVPPSEERGRIRRLLDELAARVLPAADDDEVFAYHAPAEDFRPKEEKKGSAETDDVEHKTTRDTDADSGHQPH